MLALSLGKSVRQCQAEIDSLEFARWIAFFQRAPFGPVQEDLRAGLLASLIYNSNRERSARALHPWDFFPSIKPPPKKTVREMMEMARAFAESFKLAPLRVSPASPESPRLIPVWRAPAQPGEAPSPP